MIRTLFGMMKRLFKTLSSFLKPDRRIEMLENEINVLRRQIENFRMFVSLQETINSQYQALFTSVVKTVSEQNDSIENFNLALNELVAGYYDEYGDPAESKTIQDFSPPKNKNKGKLN